MSKSAGERRANLCHSSNDNRRVVRNSQGECHDFIERQLLPHLMSFNGTNPNSIVIMDNCSVYHVDGVADTFEVIVHYLPPYSPDYNPIYSYCFL